MIKEYVYWILIYHAKSFGFWCQLQLESFVSPLEWDTITQHAVCFIFSSVYYILTRKLIWEWNKQNSRKNKRHQNIKNFLW